MVKELLQDILQKCGYSLFKRDARYHEIFCRKSLLDLNSDLVVIDVGANVGQFGLELRESGFTGKIISFEPVSASHEKLTQTAASDSKWDVYDKVAIGAKPGSSVINIANNSVSSSLLPMQPAHKQVAPTSSYIGEESVNVDTLDRVIQATSYALNRFYLKIDTQGFERNVLEGASIILKQCDVVELELGVSSVYEGDLLLSEGLPYMEARGFSLYSLYQVLMDRVTGQLFQANAIFRRT